MRKIVEKNTRADARNMQWWYCSVFLKIEIVFTGFGLTNRVRIKKIPSTSADRIFLLHWCPKRDLFAPATNVAPRDGPEPKAPLRSFLKMLRILFYSSPATKGHKNNPHPCG